MAQTRSLRRAMSTSLASAVLVPLVGLASAPILSHAVGAYGRGQVAAAIAPNVLIITIAAMGLPDALTYHLARRPHQSQRAFAVAAGLTLICGLALTLTTLPFLPVLSGGDGTLAQITLVATLIALPALLFGVFKGVAAGNQLWYRVALERTIGAVVRLVALIALLITDHLTVEAAVLVICLTPFVSGIVYLPLLWRRPEPLDDEERPPLMRSLLGYGMRAWVGSIAGILLSKLGVLLFTPLSNSTQLGLYVVGVTISDLPILLALAVKDALFGVNARSRDAEQFAMVCRISCGIALIGSLTIALSLPLWIGFVFGAQFTAAIPTTWILMGCALANVPTFVLAAGIGAWGRPGVRSIGLALTLVVDVMGFLLLVPQFGAVGAASANLVSAVFGTIYTVVGTSRVVKIPVHRLIVPTAEDVRGMLRQIQRLTGRKGVAGRTS